MILKQHINSFPTMDPHYVRKSYKRKYLDTKLFIHEMYDLFLELYKKNTGRT